MSAAYAAWLLVSLTAMPAAAPIDLSKATIVARPGAVAEAEKIAATVLVEEVESRTGIRWTVQTDRPEAGAVIVVTPALAGGH